MDIFLQNILYNKYFTVYGIGQFFQLCIQGTLLKIADQVYQSTISPKTSVCLEAVGTRLADNVYSVDIHVTCKMTPNEKHRILIDENEILKFDFNSESVEITPAVRFEPFSNATVTYRLTLSQPNDLSKLCCRLKSVQIPVLIK